MKLNETHPAGGAAPAARPHEPEAREVPPRQESETKNRRARGTAPAGRGKTPAKRSKGHPRVNGHDRASSPSAALPAPVGRGGAASVDATGASAASAAIVAAAGTDRDAYADVAQPSNGREQPQQAGAEPQAAGEKPRASGDARPRLDGGEEPLPDDIADFVDEIHSRADLFEVFSDLLNSEDEKVKQRALEKILEMKYGRGAEGGDEPVQIIMDGPRPIRD